MTELDTFGLRVWRGEVATMSKPHRHHELELNLVFQGSMNYLFGGSNLSVKAGQLLLFWGTLPHRLLESEQHSECGWLTLPLTSFLRYSLPDKLTQQVLQGQPIIQDVQELDVALFERWLHDGSSEEHKRIFELELEAWLRRLSLQLETHQTKQQRHTSKAAQLAQFISEHYQEPLQLKTIAEAADLNTSYASTLFKSTFSMTMLAYLTQHRIAHAQRLLVTTDQSVLEIAYDAGFGSSSQFYAAFVNACGITPLAYRKQVNPSSV